MMIRGALLLLSAASLVACSADSPSNDSEPDDVAVDNVSIAADWPSSLNPVGDGYPAKGDPCRRVGESEATSNYLDDSADLVGCPSVEAAKALGGKTVASVDGITLVSVPRGGANAGMRESGAVDSVSVDAKVPGTNYNATGPIPCGFAGKIVVSCNAGVKRKWGDDGTTLVEVTRPDGRKRALFFDATGKATGADSAQSDGSAGWKFKASRDDDWTVIEFGPERYRVPDAMVLGG